MLQAQTITLIGNQHSAAIQLPNPGRDFQLPETKHLLHLNMTNSGPHLQKYTIFFFTLRFTDLINKQFVDGSLTYNLNSKSNIYPKPYTTSLSKD